MQELHRWTIETIRNDDSMMSWLEERKFEWIPLVKNCLSSLLEGKSIIIVTDPNREWFCNQVCTNINKIENGRPFLPFYPLKSLFNQLDTLKNDEDILLLNDLLSVSFKNDYIFWYIGKCDDKRLKLALSKDDSFLWVFDEEIQNSFTLSSTDDLLDQKLYQLFRIFDKSINAALFNEVNLA